MVCVGWEKREEFVYGIRMCVEDVGGVGWIVSGEKVKWGVMRNEGDEGKVKKGVEEMGK